MLFHKFQMETINSHQDLLHMEDNVHHIL
jgi:hypothetical protein